MVVSAFWIWSELVINLQPLGMCLVRVSTVWGENTEPMAAALSQKSGYSPAALSVEQTADKVCCGLGDSPSLSELQLWSPPYFLDPKQP